MRYNSPHRLCYISLHLQYSNIFVNYKEMNKEDLTNNNDIKAHARKGKSLVEFNAKENTFQISEKNSKFTFYCQNQFFALYASGWNGGSSSCTAKGRVF